MAAQIDEEVKADPNEAAAENKREAKEAATGATQPLSYSSKHFSLTAGFVVLNQWKVEEITPSTAPPTFQLETGDTGANALLEASFRYRWAWLNRTPVREGLPSKVEAATSRLGVAYKEKQAAARAIKNAIDDEYKDDQAAVEAISKRMNVAKNDKQAAVEAIRKKINSTNPARFSGNCGAGEIDNNQIGNQDIDNKLVARFEEACQSLADARADLNEATAQRDNARSAKQVFSGDCDVLNNATWTQAIDEKLVTRFDEACQSVTASRTALETAITQREDARAARDRALEELARRQAALKSAEAAELAASVGNGGGAGNTGLATKRRVAQAELDEAQASLDAAAKRLDEIEHSVDFWNRQRSTTPVYGIFGPTRWASSGAAEFIPDDWAIRLGYAFAGDSDDVAAIAGASDLYVDLDMGWNLAQWSMRTATVDDVPIRGSINLELGLSWNSDAQSLDVHQRTLVGLGAAFGVPLNARQSGDSPVPIVEVAARIGPVHAETPKFINSSNTQIRLDNGLPDFKDGWGVGIDAEVNVPVPGDLGYVVLRGRLDSGFNPNPWALTLGYTIPLKRIFDGLSGSGGGS